MEENRPVIIGGVTAAMLITLFQAFIKLGRSSGWWELSDEAFADWMSLVQMAVPILVIAGSTWWTSRRTTSLALPTDEDGTRLVRVDRKPALAETRSVERKLRER